MEKNKIMPIADTQKYISTWDKTTKSHAHIADNYSNTKKQNNNRPHVSLLQR